MLKLGPAVPGTLVTRFEDWRVESSPVADGADEVHLYAVGVGDPEVVPFTDAMIQIVLFVLASDGAAFFNDLETSLDDYEWADQSPLPRLLCALLRVAGDFALSFPADVSGATLPAVDALHLASELAALRSALLVVLDLQRRETSAFWSALSAEVEEQEPGLSSELASLFSEPGSNRIALARLWLVARLSAHGLCRLRGAIAPGGPFEIDPGLRTPFQELWFTLAFSADAIVPPYPLPRVFRCSYHLCRKVFISRKLGVVGELRFCTDRHGKSYHAAKRMKAKSKKNAPKPQTED